MIPLPIHPSVLVMAATSIIELDSTVMLNIVTLIFVAISSISTLMLVRHTLKTQQKNDVVDHSETITLVKSDMTTMKTDVSTMKGDVSKMKTDVGILASQHEETRELLMKAIKISV